MIKTVDNRQQPSSDDPEDIEFAVRRSCMELEEYLEQRLENIPKGENSLKLWRKGINSLVEEINEIYGFDKYKKV